MVQKGVDTNQRFTYADNSRSALGYHLATRAYLNDIFHFQFAFPVAAPVVTVHMFGGAGATTTLNFRMDACDCTETYNTHTASWQNAGLALDTSGALTLFCHNIQANLTGAGVTAGDLIGLEMEVSALSGVSWFYLVGLCVENANFCVLHQPR